LIGALYRVFQEYKRYKSLAITLLAKISILIGSSHLINIADFKKSGK